MSDNELDSDVVRDLLSDITPHPCRNQYRNAPVRTCVGCRKRVAADELLRVVAVDGYLVADHHRRLPGRGAWLHPTSECLAKAERKRAFPRALRVSGLLNAQGLRDHLQQ